MSFLALDLGITVCKIALFDPEGKLISLVREEYPVISPYPDWAEQDTEVVWGKVQEGIIRITREDKVKEPIESICISAQGEAICFLDRKNRSLRNCILGMDMRSKKQAEKLREKFGYEKLYDISGVPPHPLTSIAKILWVKDNESEIFKNTAKFLCYEDFIFLRLAGIDATDYSLASRMMMFDINEKKWCSWILDYALALESVCFEQKISLDIFEESGFKIKKIGLLGGQTKSAKWLKIRADILGKSISTLKVSDASCLGAAILSSYALKYYPSIDEAVYKMVKVKSEIEPDENLHGEYLEKYRIFKKIYSTLKKINHEFSRAIT